MNKLLVIAFLLLLSIIGVEAYYLYNLNQNQSDLSHTTTEVGELVADEVKKLFTQKEDGILTDLSLEKTLRFKISDIIREEKIYKLDGDNGNAFKAVLIFKTATKEGFTIYFSQHNLDRISVFEMKNGKKNPLNIANLRPGDTVTYTLKKNLFAPPDTNTIEGSITRIN